MTIESGCPGDKASEDTGSVRILNTFMTSKAWPFRAQEECQVKPSGPRPSSSLWMEWVEGLFYGATP